MAKGKLIVIEGTDGSGKELQSKLLLKYLNKNRIANAYFDFPQYTSTFFGKFLKKLLAGKFGKLQANNPYLISIPYAADRWQAKSKIDKAIQSKQLVLCNRYAPSNLGYQLSRSVSKHQPALAKWLIELEYKVFRIPREHLVIFLYVPYKHAQRLMKLAEYKEKYRRDTIERDHKLLKRVDKTYLTLLRQYKHWIKIDCVVKDKLLSPQAIHRLIIQELTKARILS